MSKDTDPNGVKIYLLPNLMTAGNLFCGFAALISILDAVVQINAGLDPAGKRGSALVEPLVTGSQQGGDRPLRGCEGW